jgi:hypothetical protein
LSPVFEFLIDLVAGGLGGIGRKPLTPFPEGAGNASLGAVAAFAGALSAIFSLALLAITSFGSRLTVRDYASLIGASLAVAALGFGGRWAGVRAPAVTRRNLGLAMFGRIVAKAAIYMSIASALVAGFHVVRGVALG